MDGLEVEGLLTGPAGRVLLLVGGPDVGTGCHLLGELRRGQAVLGGVRREVARGGRGRVGVDDRHGDARAVVARGDGLRDAVAALELRSGIPARREGAGAGRQGLPVRGRRVGDRLLAPVRRARLTDPEPGGGLRLGVLVDQGHGLVEADHRLDGPEAARDLQRRLVGAQRGALDGVVRERGPERRGGLPHGPDGLDVLVVVGHVADPEALGLQPGRDGVDVRLGRGERGAVLGGGEELAVLRVAGRGHRGGQLLGGVTATVAEVDPEVDLGGLVGRADLVGGLRPGRDTARQGALAVAGCGEGR